MGTNFYARVIPKEPVKKRLHELIDSDVFSQNEIQVLICETMEAWKCFCGIPDNM